MERNVRLLYLHNFLTDFRFHTPFLIIYLAQITGSYTVAMAVLAVETIAATVMDIPLGVFSDRIGRKYTIVLGSCCLTAAVASYAFATDSMLLFVGAVLFGLSECMFSGNNNALLYESLKELGREKKFHHYQGRVSSMYQLGLGLSALAASFLAEDGLRFIVMIGIVPQILALGISFFFKEPHVHMRENEKSLSILKKAFVHIFRHPRLRVLMVAQAISWGAGEAKFHFQNAFFNTLWPTWALGLYKAFNHALGFLGFWFSGKIIERVGAAYMLVIREAYWAVSQTIALVFSNFLTPILFMTGALLFGPGQVARDKLMQEDFTDGQRATMGSVASVMGSFMFTLVALGIGFVADQVGLVWGVALGVFLTATSLPFYVWIFRKDF
jgi:MFS family permease